MVKVLHVINGLGTGGAERSLCEMLPAFRDRGLSPEVVVFHRRAEGVERKVLDAGIPVTFLVDRGHRERIRDLRRLIRSSKPDVIHTTLFDADIAGRLAAVGTGVPVVSSLVNTSYGASRRQDPSVARWKFEVVRLIDAASARFMTAGFHAITGAVRDAAVAELGIPADRVAVIPRGRSIERLGERTEARRKQARADLGLGDEPVVLNVARQEYQKGQVCLVEAAALLRERHPGLVVLIAGRDGAATAELRAAVERLGVGDVVRFLGHRDDVPDLMCAADVFAFPSRYEGLGGSVLEAMALRLPTVAADIPALREVLDGGRCGALVPVDDARALADGLSKALAGDAEVGERTDAAAKRFADHYRFEQVVDGMSAWLSAAAEGGR